MKYLLALCAFLLPVMAAAQPAVNGAAITPNTVTADKMFFYNGFTRYPPCAKAPVVTTGNITSGSAVVTSIPSTTGYLPGATVTGTGIPGATTILTTDSATQVTLSANATASTTGVSLTVSTQSDNCGSEPPNYQIPLRECGKIYSTSGARDANGVTQSNQGVSLTFPAISALVADGHAPSTQNAECRWSFGMGAPDNNYLNICMNDAKATGFFTPLFQQAWNLSKGCISTPYYASAVVTFAFNGLSILAPSGAPNIMAELGFGQLMAPGEGRLDYVTTGPYAGDLAWCAFNGMGFIANANGGFQLSKLPINCVYMAESTTSTQWITVGNTVSGQVNTFTAGSSYGAGTAPDGTAYPAGTKIIVDNNAGSFVHFGPIGLVHIRNVYTRLGSDINEDWVATAVDAGPAHLQLEYRVKPNAAQGVPSNLLSDGLGIDTVTDSNPGVAFTFLTSSSFATPHVTDPSNGTELNGGTPGNQSIVGIARVESSVFVNTPAKRYVASMYNQMEQSAVGQYTVDRTTASSVFVEPSSEVRANFIYMDAQAVRSAIGGLGTAVKYTVSGKVSNDTIGGACDVGVNLDGVLDTNSHLAPRAHKSGSPPAAVANTQYPFSFAGLIQGLTAGVHYITIVMRTNGTGTCKLISFDTDTPPVPVTTISAQVWQ